MACLTYILLWFAVSALAWGGFALFSYLAARREERKSQQDEQSQIEFSPDQLKTIDLLRERYFRKKNLPDLLGAESIPNNICIECNDEIVPDGQPYCDKCFVLLEREGFFDV